LSINCSEEFLILLQPLAPIELGRIMAGNARPHENLIESAPRGCERDKLNDGFSSLPPSASESSNIAHRNRGVLLSRSVQSQRSPFRHSARAGQSKDRRESTTEAGAPPRDCRGELDSMIAFLLSPPALDRQGDNHLMQCAFSFSFSSLNAH